MTFLASLALVVLAFAGLWCALWLIGTLLEWVANLTSVEDDFHD